MPIHVHSAKKKVVADETEKNTDRLSADMCSTNATFPFLKLPGEIRNHIYGYCLGVPGICILPKIKRGHVQAGRIREVSKGQIEEESIEPLNLPCPTLLRVNRQIYSEAHVILYSTPCFFLLHKTMPDWFRAIGREVAGIRKLCLNLEVFDPAKLATVPGWTSRAERGKPFEGAFRTLKQAQGLQELRLQSSLIRPEDWSQSMNGFIRLAIDWIRSIYLTKGDAWIDAFSELIKIDCAHDVSEGHLKEAFEQLLRGNVRPGTPYAVSKQITDWTGQKIGDQEIRFPANGLIIDKETRDKRQQLMARPREDV